MSLILLGSAPGSFGVSTAARALAAVWPTRRLLAEFDPHGGDLPLRFTDADGAPLRWRPGILSLAEEVMVGVEADPWQHTQTLAGGLPVLVGPISGVAGHAYTDAYAPVATVLAQMDNDILADCGRLSIRSPMLPVVAAADLVALLVRADVAAVWHAAATIRTVLPHMSDTTQLAVIVLAGCGRDDQTEVSEALGVQGLDVPVLGQLLLDQIGASGFAGRPHLRLAQSRLTRSARSLAQRMHATVATRALPVAAHQ